MIYELIFFSSLAICFYVYIGYPLLVAAIAAIHPRDVRRKAITPSLSVIIAAHNEEKVIGAKLENTLSMDYPSDRLEIIVVSDGSTDRTESIVCQYEKQGVHLLSLARCGKVQALNQGVAVATGEILVFTDANALLDSSALRRLVANFADPEVGGVCGNQRYRQIPTGDCISQGESLYWAYDKFIKRMESRVGSIVGADGSLYAIRRDLFVPIENPAQADDFAISMRVVTQGYRLVFEPTAVSYEEAPTSSTREFWRKVRVTNHSLRSLLDRKEAFNPWRTGFYALELLSHKVLRYLVPLLLVLVLITNALLIPASRVFQLLFLGQVLFYGGALVGYWLRHRSWGRWRLFYIPFYFCLANTAAFLGLLSLLRGERITLWQPHRDPCLAARKGVP
ncbi:MAG TPA: glycosyltransferase family 2 protein [Blastocatellia bacterium]|nr:glycosyltransferase family 2 protein [Blastocatellia bacterium]